MQILNKFWRLLSSTRLALYLISAITLAAAVGMLTKITKGPLAFWYIGIPAIKTLGLDNVFATRWFLALNIMFLVNTAACTVNQLQKAGRLRTAAKNGRFLPAVNKNVLTIENINHNIENAVFDAFTQKGYPVFRIGGEKTVYLGIKSRAGFWGSPVFHIGLVITIIGALLSQGTRMSGKFIALEGQVFDDAHQNYVTVNEGPFFGEAHGDFRVALDKVILSYSKKGLPETVSSRITVIKNGSPVKTGETNFSRPLAAGNLKFYQYSQFGYATGIRVLDSAGNETAKFRTVLETRYKPAAYEFTGKFQIPGPGDVAEARFYPDVDLKTLKPKENIYVPDNPGLAITVKRNDKSLYTGLLTIGKPVPVGGYRLVFDHYLLWSGITVVRDAGLFILYAGFWIAMAGLGLLYFVNPRVITVRVAGHKPAEFIEIHSWSARYRYFFQQEMQSILTTLQKNLTGKEKEKGD